MSVTFHEDGVYNTSYMLDLRYPLNSSFNMRFTPMLFLRLDQALQLERAAKNLKERLAIRYALYNGLSSGEIADGRIEHLDPVENRLFLPKRHWKRNCICDIDSETVKLQTIYSESRKKGPLLRSNKGGHYSREGIYYLINRVARRTNIPSKEGVSPRTLKRTFAREWLSPEDSQEVQCPKCNHSFRIKVSLSCGNLGTLQKQFSHKHLWSTAHYLRFMLDDVRIHHDRMMRKVKHERTKSTRLV